MSVNKSSYITAMISLCLFVLLSAPCFSQQAVRKEALESEPGLTLNDYTGLVKRLSYNPDDILAGDRLREWCRGKKQQSRCIDILNELVDKYPKNKNIRYHAALAYVDEVPGHTLFKKGWYSTRSMNHMTAVLEFEPNDWSAYYIRGLNSIYWPKSFRRIGKAIQDLEKSVRIADKLPPGLLKPYHVLGYIALGDAHVKAGAVSEARRIYRKGRTLFRSHKIDKRLAMSDSELEAFVEKYRDSDKPVDTSLSFLVDGGANKL